MIRVPVLAVRSPDHYFDLGRSSYHDVIDVSSFQVPSGIRDRNRVAYNIYGGLH